MPRACNGTSKSITHVSGACNMGSLLWGLRLAVGSGWLPARHRTPAASSPRSSKQPCDAWVQVPFGLSQVHLGREGEGKSLTEGTPKPCGPGSILSPAHGRPFRHLPNFQTAPQSGPGGWARAPRARRPCPLRSALLRLGHSPGPQLRSASSAA
jgi:hypothetical protein